jgi:hypothetical protein
MMIVHFSYLAEKWVDLLHGDEGMLTIPELIHN